MYLNQTHKFISYLAATCILLFISADLQAQRQETKLSSQADDYLRSELSTLAYKPSDYKDAVLTSAHISSTSGTHHLYYRQSYQGIEISGATASVHILKDGQLLKLNNAFIRDLQSIPINTTTPGISPMEAIEKVANHLGNPLKESLQQIEEPKSKDQLQKFSKGGVSYIDIPIRLMYHQQSNNTLRLCWDVVIDDNQQDHYWNILVDVEDGRILEKKSWTVSCDFEHGTEHKHEIIPSSSTTGSIPASPLLASNGSMYNVYPMPVETPAYGVRALLSDPSDSTASPFGWHDTDGIVGNEYTITRGNNCHAYEDGDNPDYSPDGGSGLLFNYSIDTTYSNTTQSEDAAITNLFYWSNLCHDLWYHYGFDEASGNFQENNYGNGGSGSDYCRSEAQDGSGTCNANFSTPTDGSLPRMQMYVCNSRDGDLDNMVIVHEYGHGISNRLTGGAGNSGCLNNTEQMGEGWSDWFGLMMTLEVGDQGTDSRGVGTWLIGENPGDPGIREHPYSTDMLINPHTYNDITGAAIPHGIGSVWCAMLWEMTWGLIDAHGFDPDFYFGTGGNNIAMALVTEALKLQPCNPGFVDGRDAILAADLALYGGANESIIWTAFAKRGLGFSADQGSSNSRSDGTEAFDLPFPIIAFTDISLDIIEGSGLEMPPASMDCRPYTDYDININLSLAVSDTPQVSVSIDSLTATELLDFELLSNALSFDTVGNQTLTLRVYNDGSTEEKEYIWLNLTVDNATSNVVTGADSLLQITLLDDDFAPGEDGVIESILFADFEIDTAGFSSENSGGDDWARGTAADATSNFWTVPDNGSTYLFFVNDDACDCDMSDVRLKSPILDLSDYNTLSMSYNLFFRELNYQGITEIAELLISTDGGASFSLLESISGNSAWRTEIVDLTAYAGMNNVQIAFRYNDGGGWLYGMAVDDVSFSGRKPFVPTLATEINSIDEQDVAPFADVFFYHADGSLLARIQNGSTDLGCVTVSLDRAGSGAVPLWDNDTSHAVMDKTYLFTPENATNSFDFTVTLYLTESEVDGWEVATGKSWNADAKIIKHPTSIRDITSIDPEPAGAGTVEQRVDSAGLSGFSASDYYISAGFNSGFSGMGIGDPGTVPVLCPDSRSVTDNPILDGVYKAQLNLTATGRVPFGGVVEFNAGTEVSLDAEFEVEAGGELEVKIEDCIIN
jgi:hypothetical protein